MGKSRDRANRSGSDPVNIGTSRLSVDSGDIKVTAQDGTTFKKIFAEEVQVGSGNNRVIFKRGSDGKAQFQSTTDGGGSTSELQVGGSSTVTNPSDLPISGNSAGDTILVTSTNNLMIYNGSGWYKIATITNATPTISSAGNASYAFATDGTPVSIEIVASDPEGVALQYKYQVTTGSLGSTAAVTNSATSGGTYSALAANTYSNNRFFKVTPSTTQAHAGAFAITFSVTDGVNTANSSASSFTLSFGVDGSYYFDGSSGDELSIADSDDWYLGTGDFTIEAWVYVKSFDSFNAILGQWPSNGGSANNSWVMETVGTELDFYTVHGGTNLTSHTGSKTLSTNKWYHVVVQRSSGTIKSYIDGTEDFSVSNGNDFNNPSSPLTIGGGVASTAGGTWNGYISNARIVKGSAVYSLGSSGNSTYFDGTGDYAQVPSNARFSMGTGDFTIEGWVYPYDTQHNEGYFIVGGSAAGGWNSSNYQSSISLLRGYADGGNLGFYGNGNEHNLTTTVNPAINTWFHFAFVRISGTLKIYIDGVEKYSASDSTNYSGTSLILGSVYSVGQAAHFDMSNFRVVKGTGIYTGNFTVPTAPLTDVSGTSILCCQTSSGTTIDNSSHSQTFTHNGNTTCTNRGPFPTLSVPTSGLSAHGGSNTKLLTLKDATPPAGGAAPADASSSNHTLTKVNDVTHSYATPFVQNTGGSIYMDGGGTSSAASAGTPDWIGGIVEAPGTNDFTVECWVYLTTQDPTPYQIQAIFNLRSGNAYGTTNHGASGVYLASRGGTYDYWQIGVGGTYYTNYQNALALPTAGAWTHIAHIRKDNVAKIFVNGNGVGQAADATNYSSETHLAIGGYYWTGNSTFNGYISNFRYHVGTVPYTISGATGGSSNFPNGGSDVLTAANVPALGADDWTIEFWIKGTHIFQAGLCQIGKDNGSLFIMLMANGTIRVGKSNVAGVYDTATQITTNNWFHIAVVNDGTANTQTTYINGVADANTGSESSAFTYTEDTVIIGGRYYSGSYQNTWYRYLSNFRITKAKVYSSNFIPPSAALTDISNCQLLTCQNSSGAITDASSNSLTITSPGSVAAISTQNPNVGTITPPTSALTAISGTKLLTANDSNVINDASSEGVSLTANGDAVATRLTPF